MCGFTAPRRARISTAARPARKPEMANAATMMAFALTPMRRTALKSSEAARIALPMTVRLSSRSSSRMATAVTPMVRMCSAWMRRPPTCTAAEIQSGAGTALTRGETKVSKAAAIMMLTPSEVSIMVSGLALRTGRKARRSMTSAAAMVPRTPSRAKAHHGSPSSSPSEHDVAADGDELAVGEVRPARRC